MSIYYRVKRRLGYDTTERYEQPFPLYEYRVTHLNGDVSEVLAHKYTTQGAFAHFHQITAATFKNALGPFAWPKYSEVRVLEGIQEIEKEQIGQTTVYVDVDKADGSVLDSGVETGAEI